MLFPYADKNTPYVLSPESLDWYLSKGWYRMGGHIFTTHFLFFKEAPFSAVWLRVDLQDFRFSKRQRKLLRRNAKLFDVSSGPRVIDAERNELYTRYAADFDGRLSPTIEDSLEDYEGSETLFNTWETTVRERVSGKLVAQSYFDLGDNSAASILGIYDPVLSTFSLGYYTMLLEMQYCMDNDIRYYYPGYVVPGYDRFDYKLRLGQVQYFDLRTERWLPYDAADIADHGPVESQRHRLAFLAEGTADLRDQPVKVLTYPLFEAGLYDIWNEDYLPYPYFYPLGRDTTGDLLIVSFDPKEQEYLVLQCFHRQEAQLMFNASYLGGFQRAEYFTDLLSVRNILFRTESPLVIVRACRHLIGGAED